ncbi:hypothetical protein CMUS01_07561 [Colletotrichum musicola]|uniref:Uncharacterized protein n=1 Tax=Colletotrichum musicola TaxID=2175873 RepID=A0A8H6KH16_9PEZI|nr:hypothetical protein CMUS01_07561 [Colletotrichum musicola]
MSDAEADQGSGDNGKVEGEAVVPQPSSTTPWNTNPNQDLAFNPLATSFSPGLSGSMQATDAANNTESRNFVPGHQPAHQTYHNPQLAPEAGHGSLPFNPAPGAGRRPSPLNLVPGASDGPSSSRLSPTAASFNPPPGAQAVVNPFTGQVLNRFPTPPSGLRRSFSDDTHGAGEGSSSARQSNLIPAGPPGLGFDQIGSQKSFERKARIRHADQIQSEHREGLAQRGRGFAPRAHPGRSTNFGQPADSWQPTYPGQPTNTGQSAVCIPDVNSGHFVNVVRDGQMGGQVYYPPRYHFNEHNYPGGRQDDRPRTPPEVAFNEADDQAFVPFVPDVPDSAPPPVHPAGDIRKKKVEDNRQRDRRQRSNIACL